MYSKNNLLNCGDNKQPLKKVVCAIIIKENKILLSKITSGAYENLWKFPCGVILTGESKVSALFREIGDELGIKGKTKAEFFCNIQHRYKNFDLDMDAFLVDIEKNEIKLNYEHCDYGWFELTQIWDVPLSPADVTLAQVLSEIKEG